MAGAYNAEGLKYAVSMLWRMASTACAQGRVVALLSK